MNALVRIVPFLLAFLLLPACADAPSAVGNQAAIHTEPSMLVFHPDTASIAVTLVNENPAPKDTRRVDPSPQIAISDLRLEGPDWAAYSVAESQTSGTLGAGEKATIHIQLDPEAMRGPGDARPIVAGEEPPEPIAPDAFREGEATLRFSANGVQQIVPVRFEDPPWWSQYFLPAILKVLLIVMGFVMPLASLLTWAERKQSAMMQDRLGPNMANIRIGSVNLRLWGILHFVADGVKMLFKEDFIPRRAHRAIYSLAPLFAFIPALVVFAIVPFGDGLCYGRLFDVLSQADVAQCADGRGGTPLQIAHIVVGLLYYFAIASLATYGTALAGWSSYNKWAILGSLRASAQMISYEVAIGLTIVGALLVYGTLEPHALVRAQLDSYWGIVLQPIALVLFMTAGIAETKRAPFDLPEGESEIIGYFVEYSGMRFGLFYLGEFIEVIFMSALVTTIFLGGWAVPFMGAQGFTHAWAAQGTFLGAGLLITAVGVGAWRASKHGEAFGMTLVLIGSLHLFAAAWSLFTGWGTALPHILVVVIGMITWGVKIVLLCWLQLLIRWTLPRFRYDQLMSLGWKGLLPLSIANIVLTAVVVYLLIPGAPVST